MGILVLFWLLSHAESELMFCLMYNFAIDFIAIVKSFRKNFTPRNRNFAKKMFADLSERLLTRS